MNGEKSVKSLKLGVNFLVKEDEKIFLDSVNSIDYPPSFLYPGRMQKMLVAKKKA